MKFYRILGSAFVLVMLAGCFSHVPDHGAISYGAEAYAPSSQNFVRTLVSPPTPGATPQILIHEFLSAIAGDQGDYTVSRLYLAPEARDFWRPGAGVRIYSDRLQLVYSHAPRDSNAYIFSGSEVGTIDEQGHYQRAAPDTALYENFSLRKFNGEWRISSLADGLALSESDVARAYRQSSIYFLNPSKKTLVPDSIYVPVNLGVSTALIRALLAGPTDWLSPAVTSAIPFDTSLVAGSVPIQQGVASVDLSAPVTTISMSDREALSAQIVWTLKQLAEVAAVRITIDGAPLIISGSGEAQSRFAFSNYSPDVLTGDSPSFVIDDHGLLRISGLVSKPTLTLVKSADNQEISKFQMASMSLDGKSIAGITPANVLVSGPLSGPLEFRVGGLPKAKWLSSSWDSDGNLWAAQSVGTAARVYVVTPNARTIPVAAAALENRNVQAFKVARDGSRVAFAIADGGENHLFVARIIKSWLGADPRFKIDAAVELPWNASAISHIEWIDATDLAILSADSPRSIWKIALDGSADINLAGIVDPVALAAAPGMPMLAVDGHGILSALVGQSWIEVGRSGYPIYPG